MPLPPSAGLPLSHLDQHTVAVALHTRSRSHVFCGWSTFHAVTDLGPILRITIESPEEPLEIILQERHWRGRIECDQRFGCDYYLNCE
jgi:hypothetical protein